MKTDGLIQTLMAGANAVAAVTPFYPFNINNLREIDLIILQYKKYLEKYGLETDKLIRFYKTRN